MLSFAKKTYSNATNDCSETRFERYLDTWKYRSEKTLNPDAFYTVNDLNFPCVSDKSPDHENTMRRTFSGYQISMEYWIYVCKKNEKRKKQNTGK